MSRHCRQFFSALVALAIFIGCVSVSAIGKAQEGKAPDFSDQDLEFFESKIRPLFVKHCYECHGDEADEAAGSLLMTSRKNLLRGGDTGPAFKSGHPDKSLLVEVVEYGGVIEMPPESKLAQEEIDLIREWIKRQAPWPSNEDIASTSGEAFDLEQRRRDHWCWQNMKTFAPPSVDGHNWPIDPLDQFILAKLEEADIKPAGDSERAVWLRRVTYDLTGLPPTPDNVVAFVEDQSPQAYEKVVDRLLDSPAFGERWARHWMDLVRYAETCGHEFDYPIPHASQYRDYLIRSFNLDVPYDQFVTEHLAGDLLQQPRLHETEKYNESVIGTGFWFFGEATHAPVDVKGDEAGRVDNQIDVMTKTFLGLTVACARCHDHKFDAISTKDYYALSGFLQSSRRQEALLDPQQRIASAKKELIGLEQQVANSLASLEDVSDEDQANWKRELLAAGEVLRRKVVATDNQWRDATRLDPEQDRLLANFEDGTYGEWTTDGDAFGDKPRPVADLPDYQGDVKAEGKFVVSSHSREGGAKPQSDQLKGTLTSPEFEVSHRYLRFLIGGGNHPNKTCVQVLVNGRVVLSQAGFNANEMRPITLDLMPWLRQKAQVRILDQESGGWGNIAADFFVLSHRDRVSPSAEDIAAIAAEHEVPPKRVEAWVAALLDESIRSDAHPAQPLSAAFGPGKPMGSGFDQGKRQWTDRVSRSENDAANRTVMLSSSDRATVEKWFYTGQAFEPAMETAGNWSTSGRDWQFYSADVVSSQRHGKRLWGVMRSPTFLLDADRIWYHIKGKDIQVRIIIDGYTMDIYNGLLFSNCSKKIDTKGQWQWIAQAGDVARYKGHRAHLEIIDHSGEGFELTDVLLDRGGPAPVKLSGLAGKLWNDSEDQQQLAGNAAEQLADAWKAAVIKEANEDQAQWVNWALSHQLIQLPETTRTDWKQWGQQANDIHGRLPNPMRVQAMADGTSENEYVFIRGNHRLLGEEAPRQIPSALVTRSWDGDIQGSGRLRLAEEITHPENPLTSRVMVNRMWHHMFGRGLVGSVDNFGVLGQTPTHPELLDYLAQEFIQDGWSVKRMLKRLALSRTYRLSSKGLAESDQADEQNQLWHRADVRRLQAEAIRDAMLHVSGRLDTTLFGSSIPIHLTPYMEGRGRPRQSGPLDGQRRRSLYTTTRRNFLWPMMLAFDAPIPFSTVGRRNTSNVPAQALILMNDLFVYQESGHFAKRILGEAESTEDRINRLYWLSFSRPATPDEVTQATRFLIDQCAVHGGDFRRDPDYEAAWQDLCHVIWNVKEFTYLY